MGAQAICVVLVLVFVFTFWLDIALVNGQGAILPDDEVEALKEIGRSLGKKDWDFSVDPCSGERGWKPTVQVEGFENAVTCNCTFLNGTLCHVVSIVLKSQNLPGILPPALVNLTFIQEIDLTRNFLNGTIPSQWASLPLVNISLIGNRLSGPLPRVFGNFNSLRSLTVEANRFSGPLPSELGNLVGIERLLLSSNEFTGELPESLSQLINLKDFRISDNSFSGKIPSFIQNWTELGKVAMQASGLEGPIPSGISLLSKMTDMRITDLNGNATQPFPAIDEMKNIKTLVLKNCSIVDKIPDFVGEMTTLKSLDLSFNRLTGEIPTNFDNLLKTEFIYLTSNFLTGTVPGWMQSNGDNIDLSYNNFALGSIGQCQVNNVNLFGVSSSGNNSNPPVPCLKNMQCTQNRFSLHINCGGKEVVHDGITYEADDRNAAPAIFFASGNNRWAISNTGNFMDDSIDVDNYIISNTSQLFINDSQIYRRARISPLSLTYYGLCLLNGNYTVKLHFAELMFRNGNTYFSLGRRIFDVYIQGSLVLKDFNIENEAGGAGMAVVKTLTAIVQSNTLEIRFVWAGKGTASIPVRGTYGPLVSAISVTPNFEIPSESAKNISAGVIVGIVGGAVFFIVIVLGILRWKGCLCRKQNINPELKDLDLPTGSFTLSQIKSATNNFDAANKVGEGGFGPVYKGLLADGTKIAVKQLSSQSKQGNREFVNEIGTISGLRHPNLVKLYGCCTEGSQLMLVYEYMVNNSLARALWGPEEESLNLNWFTRHKICVGIARGLAYLHEESRLKIVHRDIKATNVLLDEDLNPKISDFGLARLDEEDNTHISTRIAGTFGYMAPEYAMRGHLTDKADVYSFGVVALEIISGKSNTNYKSKEDCDFLLDWVYVLQERGILEDLIDPNLGSNVNEEQALRMINVALMCTNASAALRPTMSAVVSMLEGSSSSISFDDMRFKAMKDQLQVSQGQNENQTQNVSIDPSTTSSTSTPDLYPIKLDDEYLNNRT